MTAGKEEEEKLQSTFKKYNAKTQFQKDFVRSLISIPNIDLRSIIIFHDENYKVENLVKFCLWLLIINMGVKRIVD